MMAPELSPKMFLSSRLLHQCGNVLALFDHGIVIAERSTQASTSAVGYIDRELARQLSRQLHEVLRSLHAPVDQNDTGTVTELSVADDGAIS